MLKRIYKEKQKIQSTKLLPFANINNAFDASIDGQKYISN